MDTINKISLTSIESLSMADIACVYFYHHLEPELSYHAHQQAKNPLIRAVMAQTIPNDECEAVTIGSMGKEDRFNWLVDHLNNRAVVSELVTASKIAQQFRTKQENNISVLPVKPKRKVIIPNEVFVSGKPAFPHVNESENGTIKVLNTSDNLAEMLCHYGYSLKTNQMTLERELFHYGQRVSQSIEEVRSLLISLSSFSGLPKTAIDDHLDTLASVDTYHPIKQWLDTGGHWDEVHRIDDVVTCLNAKNPELATAIIKRWLVACVASLYEPVFKSKLVPILHGAQSFRKTAFVERIASVVDHAFLEGAELDPDKKDSVVSCIKSWVVELGEMERTSRKGQGALKAFITKQVDTVRPPYGRVDVKKPRQTHFIGTVNDDSFLRDETGSTRYAVIELDQAVDMDRLNSLLGWQWFDTGSYKLVDAKAQLQFWLEVKALYEHGYGWHLSNDELTQVATVNDTYSFKDSYYQSIEDRFLSHSDDDNYRLEWLTATNVCALLEVSADKSRPIGRALQRLANEKRINMKNTGGVKRYHLSRLDSM